MEDKWATTSCKACQVVRKKQSVFSRAAAVMWAGSACSVRQKKSDKQSGWGVSTESYRPGRESVIQSSRPGFFVVPWVVKPSVGRPISEY